MFIVLDVDVSSDLWGVGRFLVPSPAVPLGGDAAHSKTKPVIVFVLKIVQTPTTSSSGLAQAGGAVLVTLPVLSLAVIPSSGEP